MVGYITNNHSARPNHAISANFNPVDDAYPEPNEREIADMNSAAERCSRCQLHSVTDPAIMVYRNTSVDDHVLADLAARLNDGPRKNHTAPTNSCIRANHGRWMDDRAKLKPRVSRNLRQFSSLRLVAHSDDYAVHVICPKSPEMMAATKDGQTGSVKGIATVTNILDKPDRLVDSLAPNRIKDHCAMSTRTPYRKLHPFPRLELPTSTPEPDQVIPPLPECRMIHTA
jgi:hypothetical protein